MRGKNIIDDGAGTVRPESEDQPGLPKYTEEGKLYEYVLREEGITGANGLQSIGFEGIPLMIGLIIVACFVNLFIGSASAKWAILAPVFVPMMMLMGYDPAITQAVYRIGDSITNPLSPLFTYMPVILGYARKYDHKAGLGSVIANMIPFSVTFAIVWIIQVIVWVSLNLPLGPGGGIYL